MRALVVEDEPGVAAFVARGLREAAFAVDMADNGPDGYHLASTEPYDVVVLDLMLPGMDGLDVLRELRGRDISTPVICLTARDAVSDRVAGLNHGADDYLPKPFGFSELLARINALLRRGEKMIGNPIVVADLTVDRLSRVVRRAGKPIPLTPREFSLLEYMVRYTDQILARTMILEHVWDIHQDPLTNVVEVHINRLRKKVDLGFEKQLIHTVRGVGYVLRDV